MQLQLTEESVIFQNKISDIIKTTHLDDKDFNLDNLFLNFDKELIKLDSIISGHCLLLECISQIDLKITLLYLKKILIKNFIDIFATNNKSFSSTEQNNLNSISFGFTTANDIIMNDSSLEFSSSLKLNSKYYWLNSDNSSDCLIFLGNKNFVLTKIADDIKLEANYSLDKFGIMNAVFKDAKFARSDLYNLQLDNYIVDYYKFVDNTKVYVASIFNGIMMKCLANSIEFCKSHQRNNQKLSQIQTYQFKLADLEVGLRSSQLMTRRAYWSIEAQDENSRINCAMAKFYANQNIKNSLTNNIRTPNVDNSTYSNLGDLFELVTLLDDIFEDEYSQTRQISSDIINN